MIVIYTSPGCASCRKAKAWLKDNNLEYVEKNIFTTLLREKEIKYLLSRTNNGTDDLISKRSKILHANKIDLDSMRIDELVKFVINNPSILKRPIIIDKHNMQFGYDEEEIEVFNNRDLLPLLKCEKSCPHYDTCGKVREEE